MVYRLLVINLVTGPRAIDIEINLPVMLARDLADRALECRASFSWLQRAAIFSSGTSNMPFSKSISNPSQHNRCVGIHTHFPVCSIRPALARSPRTCRLASSATSFPLTDTMPSSKYIIALRPQLRQYLVSGLSSLVNK